MIRKVRVRICSASYSPRIANSTTGYANDVLSTLTNPLLAMLKAHVRQYLTNAYNGIFATADREYLEDLLFDLIAERNERANEVESNEVTEAAEIADRLLPYAPYGILCIDGRVTMTSKFGMFARMKGGSIQLPAGDPKEFLRGVDRRVFLAEPSHMAQQLDAALKRESDDTIVQILDSHLGCAARKAEADGVGTHVEDDGLLLDIERKREVAAAMQAYVAKRHSGKKILPIQGAFNPHNGFAYSGLESDAAVTVARKEGGFTSAVLERLVTDGVIISTQQVADHFREIFEARWQQFEPAFNWQDNYKETALQFWRALEGMKPDVLPGIIEVMTKKGGPYSHVTDSKELEMRALLLLANAFSGFCNNHEGEYAFSEHEESFVSVTPRDYRPFRRYMGFGVYDEDLVSLARNVVFAAGIVRKNRAAERVRKPSLYKRKEDFNAASVPVVVKEVIREDQGITIEGWEALQEIDWSFIEQIPWMEMSDAEFRDFLGGKFSWMTVNMAKAINHLRRKMVTLYNPLEDSATQMVEGKLVLLPVICDSSRRFRLVIPFFMRGFRNKS